MDEQTAFRTIEALKNQLQPQGFTVNLAFETTSDSIQGSIITESGGSIPIQLNKLVDTAEWELKQLEQTGIVTIPNLSDLNGLVLLSRVNLVEILPDRLINARNVKLTNLIIKFMHEMENALYIAFHVTIDTWELPIGGRNLEIDDFTIQLAWENERLSGSFQGRTKIVGNEETPVQGDLQNGFILAGNLGAVELTSLASSWGASLKLPSGFPRLVLPQVQYRIEFSEHTPFVLLYAQTDDFGQLTIVVRKINDNWESFVIIELLDGWKFSNLSSLLQPLDILQIKEPTLTLASVPKPDFNYTKSDGTEKSLNMRKDFNLSAELILQGAGLEFVEKLIGRKELPLLLHAAESFTEAEVSVDLKQKIVLLPDVIIFDQFAIDIDPQPLVMELICEATITIFGTALPQFRTSATIEEGRTELSLETIEPWENVFGIRGFKINKAIFEMETAPSPKYGIYGDVAISDKTIRMAAQLIGNAPSMIAGSLQGELSLKETIRDLVGLQLPDILDLSIKDFNIYAVADPQGVTIGDIHFDPGFALQGTLGILGLDLFVKVIVDPHNGIYAHGSLSQIISLGDVLKISNATGDGPPSATLDTRTPSPGTPAPPILQLSGMFDLLGLKESIEVSIEKSEFEFRLKKELGISEFELHCKVKQPNFSAEGDFQFDLNVSTGPITVAGYNLGRIKINTGFKGSTSVSFQDGQFRMSIDGKFHFQGNELSLPKLQLTAQLESLEKLPELIKQQISDNAGELFKDMLADPNKWLQGIKDELIEGVENVSKVLKDKFSRSAEQIGTDIRNTLGLGSAAAAQGLKDINEGAENIARVLKALGDPSGEVRAALVNAGFPSEDISHAMQVVFSEIAHIDFPSQGHIDTPLTPHIDMPLTPHVDIAEQGHCDIEAQIHVDVPGQGHIDAWTGHIDSGGFIHGDFGGIHGDTSVTPHLDTPLIPHCDTPLTPHGDIASIGHGDVSEVGHADSPATPHGDAP
ncbi:hypothetical protein ACFFSY_18895 [Paenibacillus aurantiacus]|uniref:Uncharacterized protein n=1 Tax=Paenibacillus aurantiacus TaxID=1936118 RepID=A0ABV5KRY7_9BACL